MIRATELSESLGISPQLLNKFRSNLDFKEEELESLDDLSPSLDSYRFGRNRYITPNGSRKLLTKLGYTFPKKNISVVQLKGGTGKSMTSVHLARELSNLGLRILLIDGDKQGNSSRQILSEDTFKYVLFDVLNPASKVTLKNAIVEVSPFLSILPSDLRNQKLENLINDPVEPLNKAGHFRELINDAKLGFDIVIFDSEPNLNNLNFMILSSSDLNICPVKLDRSSFDGLKMVLDYVDKCKKKWPEFKEVYTKVLVNDFDGRKTSSLSKIADLSQMGVPLFETMISSDHSFTRFMDGLPLSKRALSDIRMFSLEILELKKKSN